MRRALHLIREFGLISEAFLADRIVALEPSPERRRATRPTAGAGVG